MLRKGTAQSDYMFFGCSSLVGGEGTTFKSSVIDKTYARPDGKAFNAAGQEMK